jgi:predicted transcriptional regulator
MRDMVALEILACMRDNPRITPQEIAAKTGISTQYVRNTLRVLTELKLAETPVRGVYLITERGLQILQ